MEITRFWSRLTTKVLPNLHWLPQSEVRVCNCCQRLSVIVCLSRGDERRVCVRCRANLRYEMLADAVRNLCPNLSDLEVLELDPRSPLRATLVRARRYHRSYFSAVDAPGSIRPDGARCEDITELTFSDQSLDLIISSDVLEHVPDVEAAFRETARVLRPGGSHLFTAPPRPFTRKRAEIVAGVVVHLAEPEYHSDPLDPKGILAYWDLGEDLAECFSRPDMLISRLSGPRGTDHRSVWRAQRRQGLGPATLSGGY